MRRSMAGTGFFFFFVRGRHVRDREKFIGTFYGPRSAMFHAVMAGSSKLWVGVSAKEFRARGYAVEARAGGDRLAFAKFRDRAVVIRSTPRRRIASLGRRHGWPT